MHPIDGTIPIPALLASEESLLSTTPSVGIYNGNLKHPLHQSGTVHLTSHRLFYIDNPSPATASFALALDRVTGTEYWAGFLKSSAKVALTLDHPDNDDGEDDNTGQAQNQLTVDASRPSLPSLDKWTCEVCDEQNTGGSVCSLCGIARSVSSSSAPAPASVSDPASQSPHSTLDADTELLACPACTFLNHPSLTMCEICSTPLPAKSAPISRSSTPFTSVTSTWETTIKLSFRKGGDKPFYALLKRTLFAKAWAVSSPLPLPNPSEAAGIQSILSTLQSRSNQTSSSLSTALADLDQFTIKARDMLTLARSFNSRLSSSESISKLEPEEARFIRTSLASLGIQNSTSQNYSTETGDSEERLLGELSRILPPLLELHKIITLDVLWATWNRTRSGGLSLLPPSTLLSLLSLLPKRDQTGHRTLPSGLQIISASDYTPEAFSSTLLEILDNKNEGGGDGKTTLELYFALQSFHPQIGVGIVEELVLEAEMRGAIVRDDPREGQGQVRWWRNIFQTWRWDGAT